MCRWYRPGPQHGGLLLAYGDRIHRWSACRGGLPSPMTSNFTPCCCCSSVASGSAPWWPTGHFAWRTLRDSSEETLLKCWAGSGGSIDVAFSMEALSRRPALTGWCDSLAKANSGSQRATTSADADFLHGGVVVATPAPPLTIHRQWWLLIWRFM